MNPEGCNARRVKSADDEMSEHARFFRYYQPPHLRDVEEPCEPEDGDHQEVTPGIPRPLADWDGNLPADSRFPVLREGERDPIPQLVRVAVYLRDQNRCTLCHRDMKGLEKNLDHVLPWSANGSDLSTNLRTTCPDCNENRSNRPHPFDSRHLLPVTWWCIGCWTADNATRPPWIYGYPWANDAFTQPHIDPSEALLLAFCAVCDRAEYTSVTL